MVKYVSRIPTKRLIVCECLRKGLPAPKPPLEKWWLCKKDVKSGCFYPKYFGMCLRLNNFLLFWAFLSQASHLSLFDGVICWFDLSIYLCLFLGKRKIYWKIIMWMWIQWIYRWKDIWKRNTKSLKNIS